MATLQEQFDWYSAEIEKHRVLLNKKRQEFFDADAKVSYLERDRAIVWRQLCDELQHRPQDTTEPSNG
jgi:hypothetical protein